MARVCELTGKKPQSGHRVSHSNVKTNRRFNPNLQNVTLYSDALRRKVRLRVCTRALRSVQRYGGLDAFLLGTDDARLGDVGLGLKRRVRKALSAVRKTPAAASA
jgi:large subunit ribosomal protein L28